MRYRPLWTGLFLLAFLAAVAHAEDTPPSDQWIKREEFDKVLKDMARMKTELEALKADRAAKDRDQTDREAEMEAIQKQVHNDKGRLDALEPGLHQLVIVGDATVGFTAMKGGNSSFNAGVAPVFLYHVNDKLLFEVGLDIGIGNDPATGDGSSSVDLAQANVSYLANDYITVTGGLFVIPFGRFHNHFDPPWINKLPDTPLPFGDGGIAADNGVGLMVHGGVPIPGADDMRVTYDVYVINGPHLVADNAGSHVPGTLGFDAFDDNNNGKSIGGRLGFLPVPQLEVGYSILAGEVNNRDTPHVGAILQAVDAQYKKELACIAGTVDARVEFVWSHVDQTVYDPDASMGFGPLFFGNDRNGGLAQVSYRPTRSGVKVLEDLEFIVRYDWLRSTLDAPGGDHEQRLTLGLDYWLASNAVLKFAYVFDHQMLGLGHDILFVQFGVGF